MSAEHIIQNECAKLVSALEQSMFYRQNTGMAWQSNSKPIRFRKGASLVHPNGGTVYLPCEGQVMLAPRPVSFGLEGCGDYVGALRGLPVQLEFKNGGKSLRESQARFAKAWRNAGGVYIKAGSVAEFQDKLRRVERDFFL